MDQNFSYLQDVLEGSVVCTGADFGTLYVILEHQQKAYLAAQLGFPPGSLADTLSIDRIEPGGALVRAVATRKSVFIEDIELDEEYAPLRPQARLVGFRSVSATPLINRNGAVIGALILLFKRALRFSEFKSRIAAAYAQMAGLVIEAGRLKADLARRVSPELSRKISDVELKAAIRRLRQHPNNVALVEQIIALGDQYISQLITELENSERRYETRSPAMLPEGWINRRTTD